MPTLDQAVRFLDVLSKPGALTAVRRTRPFSSSAFIIARDLHTSCGELATIIDVGANIGQFSAAMAALNPSAEIIALEPLPDVAATLRANIGDRPRTRVLECAAGSTTATVDIHRHAHTLSSSMLPTTDDFAEVFPAAAAAGEVSAVPVQVACLDDLLDVPSLRSPMLLKLDVQGFEIEALKGATTLLSRCDWVLAETAVERVYDGEPLFDDLREHLAECGFVIDRPIDFLRGARGPISQMDVLFRRSGAESGDRDSRRSGAEP